MASPPTSTRAMAGAGAMTVDVGRLIMRIGLRKDCATKSGRGSVEYSSGRRQRWRLRSALCANCAPGVCDSTENQTAVFIADSVVEDHSRHPLVLNAFPGSAIRGSLV